MQDGLTSALLQEAIYDEHKQLLPVVNLPQYTVNGSKTVVQYTGLNNHKDCPITQEDKCQVGLANLATHFPERL